MDSTFDLIVIGAGPGGEAISHKARSLGAAVAVIDRRWFGGSCPHIGCLPSKALLHAAAEHHANPARYEWPRASKHRDFMINRPADAPEPDDTSHVRALEKSGAVVYRGDAEIIGKGRVSVTHDGARHELFAANVVIAAASADSGPGAASAEWRIAASSRSETEATSAATSSVLDGK